MAGCRSCGVATAQINTHQPDRRNVRKTCSNIVKKSDDLAAGYKDRQWGIAIKHEDSTVKLVRGGRS
jgi:hypothetical protein